MNVCFATWNSLATIGIKKWTMNSTNQGKKYANTESQQMEKNTYCFWRLAWIRMWIWALKSAVVVWIFLWRITGPLMRGKKNNVLRTNINLEKNKSAKWTVGSIISTATDQVRTARTKTKLFWCQNFQCIYKKNKKKKLNVSSLQVQLKLLLNRDQFFVMGGARRWTYNQSN